MTLQPSDGQVSSAGSWIGRFHSGHLKGILLDVAAEAGWNWQVELVPNPDTVLASTSHVVASTILNHCRYWVTSPEK